MTTGAALLAGLAVALWFPPGRVVVALRLAAPGGDTVARRRTVGRPWELTGRRVALLPLGVAGGLAPWLVDSPASALVLATAAAIGAHVATAAVAARRRAAAEALATRVATGVELLAAELRTGAPPSTALRGTSEDLPELVPVAAVAERGGDVAAALDVVGSTTGAEALLDLAAAWRVAERSGAPVAGVLDRLADAARADREVAREVRAEGASARATARLLAALPLLGLGLGSGLGGDPVHVLLRTLPGAVCLAAGSALAVAGLVWVERIGAAAESVR